MPISRTDPFPAVPELLIIGRNLLSGRFAPARTERCAGDLEFRTAVLLAIAVWCFCRFYYFAFCVIEHYVDGSYRFSGLWSFARYLLVRWRDRGSA